MKTIMTYGPADSAAAKVCLEVTDVAWAHSSRDDIKVGDTVSLSVFVRDVQKDSEGIPRLMWEDMQHPVYVRGKILEKGALAWARSGTYVFIVGFEAALIPGDGRRYFLRCYPTFSRDKYLTPGLGTSELCVLKDDVV